MIPTRAVANPWLVLVVFGAVSALLVKALIQRKRVGRLPPGPRPLPILGNVLDIPRSKVGPSLFALSKSYGDVIYFNILGLPVLTINSLHHALELLDKKSANLSSRPSLILLELLGLDRFFVFMPYGREWREHRRAFHKTIGPESMGQWQSIQLKTARKLLSRLIESPKDFAAHLNIAITETIMRVAYGIELAGDESDREYFRMVDRVIAVIEPMLNPAAHIMEVFPFLRWLPSWLPGMGFKRDAYEKRSSVEAVTAHLYRLSTTATDDGVIRDSMVTHILGGADAADPHGAGVQMLSQYATATTFLGGIETSHATMEAFFLAMAMHPGIQKKAQRELDAIVGPDRLPEFSDLDSLPYLKAIIKETLRWHIVGPLGVAHVATADEEYLGYRIPAGTIINPNIWAMSRDPHEYPDPELFLPERFLPKGDQPPSRDPAEYVYGFGRRLCPGRHFARTSMFIYCATVLHALDIQPPIDEHGVPVKIEYRATDTMISHVQGYKYIIKPRRSSTRGLVGEVTHNL